MKIYRFQDCYLDAVERRIFKHGILVELTPRAFDVMRLLVENAGSVVTKNDLIREVWSDSFVEEGNIPVQISKLRRVLGGSKNEPFIETVSGTGYRFVARVEIVDEEEYKNVLSNQKKPAVESGRENAVLDSIAVLPFHNEQKAPDLDYLADGLTESIINNLSFIPDFRVIARSSAFRFKDLPASRTQEAGVKLNVATVLTGRVKVIGENVSIGVELMRVSDNSQLWGNLYNQPFSDIFEIQEKISQSISQVLRAKISNLAQKSVHGRSPQNARAYALYLKGRHFWAKRSITDTHRAIKYFQESIAAAPHYSASFVGLADCYISLYQTEQLSREQTATFINSLLYKVTTFEGQSSESLAIVGHAKSILEWDLKTAEASFQESINLNPNNAITLHKYANMLNIRGKFEESISYHLQALTIDPLSTAISGSLARVFYLTEQYDIAITNLLETLELDSENLLTLLLLSVSLAAVGRYDESLKILHSIPHSKKSFEITSMTGYVFALAGRTTEARQIIEQLSTLSKVEKVDPINFAYIYTALGEFDEAFKFLELAFLRRSFDLIALKIDPRFKPLRADNRFKDLVKRIGVNDN